MFIVLLLAASVALVVGAVASYARIPGTAAALYAATTVLAIVSLTQDGANGSGVALGVVGLTVTILQVSRITVQRIPQTSRQGASLG